MAIKNLHISEQNPKQNCNSQSLPNKLGPFPSVNISGNWLTNHCIEFWPETEPQHATVHQSKLSTDKDCKGVFGHVLFLVAADPVSTSIDND